MQILNDPWPWFGTLHGRPLDVAELIRRGTLSQDDAAALWFALDRGASLFVAAGPPGAGKSTVANAMLEFLPLDAQVYVTSGAWDRLDVPANSDTPLYLLVNELSCHMHVYLCGEAAHAAFALLDSGTRMLGTLHARSAEESLQVMCDEAGIRPSDLRTPFVFAVVSAQRTTDRIIRRVVEIGFLPPGDNLHRLHPESLAAWSGEPQMEVQSALAERAAQLATQRRSDG